ncbi:MAG: hypothetical protein ABI824_00285 [Acidobacteriota bacterium]
MLKPSLLLLPIVLTATAFGANFQASVSGNWNNPVTWGKSAGTCVYGSTCPGAGDSAVINNSVTVTCSLGVVCVIGTSPATGGTTALTCASADGTGVLVVNGTLQMKGPVVQSNCSVSWTIGAGGTLDHDTSSASVPNLQHYTWTGYLLSLNGSSGNHVTISNHAGGGTFGGFTYVGGSEGGIIHGTYVDFSGCGTTFCSNFNMTTASWSCDHCSWTNSGPMIRAYEGVGSGSVLITNARFTSPSAGNAIDLSLAGVGAGITISHSYIEGTLPYYLGAHPSHLDITDDVIFGQLNNSGVADGIPMSRTLIYSDNPTSGGPNYAAPGTGAFSWTNNYFARGCRAGACSNNPHWFDLAGITSGNAMIDGAVIDCELATCNGQGDAFQITGVPSVARTVTVKNTIALWNPATGKGVGTLINQSDSIGSLTYNNLQITLDHNTYVSSTSGGDCGGMVCVENNSGITTQPAGVFQAISNSILWGTETNAFGIYINNVGAVINNGAYVGVDYNAHYGIRPNPYLGAGTFPGSPGASAFASPASPGTHDLTSDAAFLDNTRNLLRFCQLHDSTVATYTDCVAKFATLNDAIPVPWAVVTDLYTWVRTGFTPTNAAYSIAGSDGSTIGAVPFGAVTTITDIKVTPTQIRIAYTAPASGACRVEASRDSSYSPLVVDLNSSLFSGADLDSRTGAWTDPADPAKRVFVIGTRTISTALDGKDYSRALAQLTTHYIRVGCGSGYATVATTSATTDYPTYGRSTRDPLIGDANGAALWPTMDYNNRSWESTEPFTGALIKPFGLPLDVGRLRTGVVPSSCVYGTGWSGGCNVLSGSDTSYSGTTQQVLGLKLFAPFAFLYEDLASVVTSWNYIITHVTGQVTGTDVLTADRTTQFGLSFDGAATPTSGVWVDAVLPTSSGTIDIGTKTVGDLVGARLRAAGYQSWANGYLYNSGSSTTVNFTLTPDCNLLLATQRITLVLDGVDTAFDVVSTNCGASPATMVLSAAVALDPTPYTGATGWPFRYYSGFEYNPHVTLLIRKKSTTANNTIHLTGINFDSGHGGYLEGSSGGFAEFGSQFYDSNGFSKMRMGYGAYAMKPDTGEVRYLGLTNGETSAHLFDQSQPCASTSLYALFIDANSFYCAAPAFTGGTAVFKGTFTGNAANDVASTGACLAGGPCSGNPGYVTPDGITWTQISGDIIAGAKVFNPSFDDTHYVGCSVIGFTGGRYLQFQCGYAGGPVQDVMSWFIVYDVGNGLPIGSGGDGQVVADWNPSLGPGYSAWSVYHTGFMMAPEFNSYGSNFLVWQGRFPKGGDGPGTGAYSTTYAGQYWNGSSFVTGDMPAGCTPTCRIKVAGTPTSTDLPTTYQDIGVGQAIQIDYLGNREFVVTTAVNAADDITILRGVDTAHGDYPIRAWPAGTRLSMRPWWGITTDMVEGGGPDAMRWDFLQDPHGPTDAHIYTSRMPGGGHSVNYDKWSIGTACSSAVVTPSGISADRSRFPMLTYTFQQGCDAPLFAGTHYAPNYGDLYEQHPSFKPTPWPVVVDSHPDIGHGGAQNNLTHLTGSLFELVYTEIAAPPITSDGMSRKFFPSSVSGSGRILRDISGPGSVIPTDDTGDGQYCVALVANECRTGSTAGHVYINDKRVVPNKFNVSDLSECAIAAQNGDLCFADHSDKGNVVEAYHIPSDTSNPHQNVGFFPVLEQFGMCPRPCRGNTDNVKLLWGNWAQVRSQPQREGELAASFLAKVPDTPPPYTADNSTFATTTVTVSSVPLGTDNVVVEFGYLEYGSASNRFCTSRHEKCVANNSTIDARTPFFYPTEGTGGLQEGIPGVSCTSSCTVAIPTIPGYVVYSKLVYRDANNATISTLELSPSGGVSSLPAGKTIVVNGAISGLTGLVVH